MYKTLSVHKLEQMKASLTEALLITDTLLKLEEARSDNKFWAMNQEEKKQHILKGMATFFRETEETLFARNRMGDEVRKKFYGCYLLVRYAKLRSEAVAEIMGYSARSTVSNATKKMDGFLSPKPYGDDEIKGEWELLLLHLGITQRNDY